VEFYSSAAFNGLHVVLSQHVPTLLLLVQANVA